MSELEKIVDHVVQHEEKRQAEKIKLESEIKDLEEVLEHGISTKFVEEEVIYVYSPKTAHDMREKLEENYKQLHAQLTIPKSIADELEKYDFELTSKGLMYRNIDDTLVEFSRVTYDEIPQLIVQTIAGNYRIVFAYLNPLTRDLVKVV
ncbi:hypothetical protein [Lactococcus lactis]|uniref:hypothetical protein n=1 Tax=Lactococcus lactis TaxID=1358 RepID=UPI0021A923B3|nr:hypothetical protein [Lactococcus lactis]MCT3132943.1 hypothetical protein [Lactococcus lactis]